MELKKTILKITIGLIATILINLIGNIFYKRIDITEDKRYTLSEATKKIITNVEDELYIDIYLSGDMPSEFKRLQNEVKTILEQFNDINSNLLVDFDVLNTDEYTPEELKEIENMMVRNDMSPAKVDSKINGKTIQETIFPWAVINYNKKIEKVRLLKTNSNNSIDRVNNSVQHLEYAFANAIKKISTKKSKKIGYLLGNNELKSKYVYSFLQSLENSYHIIPFDLDSINNKPLKTLKDLNKLDLFIVAKPEKKFSEKQKYAIDQYTVNGGKSLWLIDKVKAELDSISAKGQTLALGKDLNLTDLFFQYGFRINPVLIKDIYSAGITTLNNNNQPNQVPWFYNPVAIPTIKHSIVNNINPVRFEFANQIKHLKQGIDIKKTPLLQTSNYTATAGVPKQISANEIILFQTEDVRKSLTKQKLNLASLFEGSFTSAYKNRIKPFIYNKHKDQNQSSKMIVIADGDVIKNQIINNRPMPLRFDRNNPTQEFGNGEFLLNAVNYLLDDTGLMEVRNKEVKIPFLDVERIEEEKLKWQLINILLPLLILVSFGFCFNYLRKRKYR